MYEPFWDEGIMYVIIPCSVSGSPCIQETIQRQNPGRAPAITETETSVASVSHQWYEAAAQQEWMQARIEMSKPSIRCCGVVSPCNPESYLL